MKNCKHVTSKSGTLPKGQSVIIHGVICVLATMGILLWPRLMPIVFPVIGMAALVAVLVGGHRSRAIQPGPIFLCLILFGAYLLINASWSADLGRAYGKAGLFFLLVATAHWAINSVKKMDSALVEGFALSFSVAAMLSAAIVLAELLSSRAIMRYVFSLVPALAPTNPKDITILDGGLVWLSPHNLNRNITMLNMILWPALLVFFALPIRPLAKALALGLFTVTALATFASEHETSKIALAFAAFTFLAFRLWPKGARLAVAAGWLAAIVLVIPASHFAYQQNLHAVYWLPETAKARVILWKFTATEVARSPFFGIGMASTRTLDEQNRRSAVTLPDHVLPMRTGRHAHNIYLQTWYELGLIGALLLLPLGFTLMFWIIHLSARSEPFLLAGFVSVAVIGAFGWGMWQSWFMAAFFATAVFTVLSAVYAEQHARPSKR